MSDFEAAFENFMKLKEYDIAATALFTLIHEAFKAGWMAGSNPITGEIDGKNNGGKPRLIILK